jgi:hypothetical protein
MPCRKEVGIAFVALGILEAQTARHYFDQPQSRAIGQTQLEGPNSKTPISEFGPGSYVGTREHEDCRPN